MSTEVITRCHVRARESNYGKITKFVPVLQEDHKKFPVGSLVYLMPQSKPTVKICGFVVDENTWKRKNPKGFITIYKRRRVIIHPAYHKFFEVGDFIMVKRVLLPEKKDAVHK